YIIISDELKKTSASAVGRLRKAGVKNIIMLTGDNHFSAKSIADKLGITDFAAGLLPHDKVQYIESIMNDSNKSNPAAADLKSENGRAHKVVFVGDGINDAPVIARADIGIAMGGLGSDAAVEAADVVIMEDDPSKVAEAIQIAKRTRTIVWQNIIFALGIKAFFI